MKITWNNLHCYVIGLILLNLLMILTLSDKTKEYKDYRAIISFKKTKGKIKQSKNITLTNTTLPLHNSSVAEDIGKSISSSHQPIPFPETGKLSLLNLKTNIKNKNQDISQNTSYIIGALIFLAALFGIYIFQIFDYFKKSKDKYEREAQYILISKEN